MDLEPDLWKDRIGWFAIGGAIVAFIAAAITWCGPDVPPPLREIPADVVRKLDAAI